MDAGDIYWDFQDPNKRASVVGLQQTLTNLTAMLGNVFNLLSATPGMQSTAGFFNPNRAGVIQGEAAQGQFDFQLRSLYFTEASVVRGAAKAGLALAQFLQTASSQPTDAIAALANFGSNITDAFNQSIKSLYGGDAVRPLGSLAFI